MPAKQIVETSFHVWVYYNAHGEEAWCGRTLALLFEAANQMPVMWGTLATVQRHLRTVERHNPEFLGLVLCKPWDAHELEVINALINNELTPQQAIALLPADAEYTRQTRTHS